MSILLTCAGRRNYLIEYFRKAFSGPEQVFVADASEYAPALYEADKSFIVPDVNHPEYISSLLEICFENKVNLLIPLNDLELPLLAHNKDKFIALGTTVVISSPQIIYLCFDKLETLKFCSKIGIAIPKTYLSVKKAINAVSKGEVTFPLVVKPRWGSASIGIEYVYDSDELAAVFNISIKRLKRTVLRDISGRKSTILIQEMLKGQEYGLDVINDLNGNHRAVFIKRKIGMRAGETDKAETVLNSELGDIGRRIGEKLGHIGNLDCDIYECKGQYYVLDMNPRFGGGYPFSHFSGANLPAALIAWARGEEAKPEWLKIKPGVFSAKCDKIVGGDLDKCVRRTKQRNE